MSDILNWYKVRVFTDISSGLVITEWRADNCLRKARVDLSRWADPSKFVPGSEATYISYIKTQTTSKMSSEEVSNYLKKIGSVCLNVSPEVVPIIDEVIPKTVMVAVEMEDGGEFLIHKDITEVKEGERIITDISQLGEPEDVSNIIDYLKGLPSGILIIVIGLIIAVLLALISKIK